jgi:hypothetical protein
VSQLAAGRVSDMNRLVSQRDNYDKYTAKWNETQLKIDDLIEEGKCPVIRHERERLVRAARAGDSRQIMRISAIITEHMKTGHRKRYLRQWLKKG